MNHFHATEQQRRAEELVCWTCGERIRFAWFRLCLTVQEMAYTTGQIIEFQMGLTSPDNAPRAIAQAQEQARQEAERMAAYQRQVEQLQGRIRERSAAQDWDAVVAASDELAALDPAAADPGGLASAAREQVTRRQQAERAPTGAQKRADDQLTEPGQSTSAP